MGGLDLRAAKRDDVEAFACRRPLPADRLALAARQGGEEIVEGGIAAIEPVELDAVTDQPAARLGGGRFFLGQEIDVGGR